MMSVIGWVSENEGFFSGLVAIAALIGISGAAARLLWVRASRLGPGATARRWGWAIAAGGLIAIAAVALVILNFWWGESESQDALRPAAVPNAGDAPQTTNNMAKVPDFGGRPAIAVLPFDNLSPDPDEAFFADGLAEDLITRLSSWRAFPVIARNSSFQYRGGDVDLKRVSAELGVRYVVEGSVRRANDRIRVTAQLIDAPSGEHVWAETYDREVRDLFSLQDEISETIAASLVDDLNRAEGERARLRGTENLEAWSVYQLGLQHADRFTRADYGEAARLFEQVVALDPRFATAHAQLALARVAELMLGRSDAREEVMSAAVTSARRAVELDARDPAAHAALGAAHLVAGDPKNGLDSTQRAVDLNPSMPEAWIWFGWAQLLAGNPEVAIVASERAQRLNPRGPMVWFYDTLSAAYWELGRYAAGLEAGQRLVAAQPAYFPGYAHIAMNAVALGQLDDARAAIAEGRGINPDLSLKLMQGYFGVSRSEIDARRNDALREAGLE
jgi:adenylate cyclase